jgi:hypothetical protein
VDSEERASELAARLDGGEDFQTLVDELEADENVTGYGTELDWLPRSMLERRLDVELSDLAFELEVGQHSGPVPSQDGTRYSIIEVVGREDRELDGARVTGGRCVSGVARRTTGPGGARSVSGSRADGPIAWSSSGRRPGFDEKPGFCFIPCAGGPRSRWAAARSWSGRG